MPDSPGSAAGSVGFAAPPTSLKPVIDVLPASVYENPTWRGMTYFLRDTAMYVALLAVLVLVSNIFAVLALEVLMGLVVSGLFVVGHDAAHGALFSSKRMNSTVAHLAMLPSFHVYEGWVLGHNRVHHPTPCVRAMTSSGTPRPPSSSPGSAGGAGPSTVSSGRGRAPVPTTPTRCGGRR